MKVDLELTKSSIFGEDGLEICHYVFFSESLVLICRCLV
jgi:hypothetical protein